ncbi:MAG TPA: NEW3 domain-containing protein, partial [Candidatus Limnocylindrales bacterium]|nr:NEW3 domain-containing protein [Candidatus Limnocylindrales bacterium]
VVVAAGSHISFSIDVKTSPAARVDLALGGVPSGWTATLQGGGFVVNAVQTNGTDAVNVRLDIGVPADASGTTHLTVTGTALGRTATLGLDVTVQAQAGGDVQLTTDVPSVQGSSSSNFTFNVAIHNNTPGDLTFTVAATGPTGWTVDAKLTSSAQAASAVVTAGAVGSVTVTATAPTGAAAGSYPIQMVATSGDKQYTQDLTIKITGTYTLSMTTPTQVLSNQGTAGSATEQQIVISNDGTAPVTNVKVTATQPTNWTITFDKSSIDSIPAGQTATVTATVTPSSDAITGDYNVSFSASSDQSTNATLAIRFTVQTSIVGALVGIALIILVFVGLWWVFRRYGRR